MCFIQIEDSKLKFVLMNGDVNEPLSIEGASVTDGKWHNVTVTGLGNNFILKVDETTTDTKNFGSSFDFSSVDVTEMKLSGERTVPTGTNIPGNVCWRSRGVGVNVSVTSWRQLNAGARLRHSDHLPIV